MAVGSSTTPDVLDARMWRLLKARCHPDMGGDHELFVWLDALYVGLEGRGFRASAPEAPPNKVEAFIRACTNAHAEALAPLVFWWEIFNEIDDSPPVTKKQVAYIARLVGMTDRERLTFYGVCEAFELTRRAASHLIEEHKNAY
jgi:hypothetical protein